MCGILTHPPRRSSEHRIVLENNVRLPLLKEALSQLRSNWPKSDVRVASTSLRVFFADRLKVHLREQGARHDLVDAVFALGGDDLLRIVKRVEALGRFLDTEDGAQSSDRTMRASTSALEEKKYG